MGLNSRSDRGFGGNCDRSIQKFLYPHLTQIESVFEHVSQIRSQWKRRLTLDSIAPFFGFPRASFRKAFEEWTVEKHEGARHG